MKTYTLEEVKAILYNFVESTDIAYIMDGYYSGCQISTANTWIRENLDKNEPIKE